VHGHGERFLLSEGVVTERLGLFFVRADRTLELREFEQAFGLEFFEKLPAFMRLQAPVGTPPFQKFADGEGEFSAAEPAAVPNSFLDQFEFVQRHPLTAKPQVRHSSHQNVTPRSPFTYKR